jgi:hypothetical protein
MKGGVSQVFVEATSQSHQLLPQALTPRLSQGLGGAAGLIGWRPARWAQQRNAGVFLCGS